MMVVWILFPKNNPLVNISTNVENEIIMESARTFLFILFAFLTFLLYNAWQEHNAPEPVVKKQSKQDYENYSFTNSETAPKEKSDQLESEIPADTNTVNSQPLVNLNNQPIEVTTDTLRVFISPVGGDIILAELLQYKETLEEDSAPLNILENRNGRVFVAQTGLFGIGAPEQARRTHYQSAKKDYAIQQGENELTVNLTWTNDQGVKYTKQFIFHRGKYLIDVNYIIQNNSGKQVANRMYAQFNRDRILEESQKSSGIGMSSYMGAAYSTEESKYEKYDFDSMDEADLDLDTKQGWVGYLQHYFVTAWIPKNEGKNSITSSVKKVGDEDTKVSQIRIKQPWVRVEPGETATITSLLYVGPKIQSELAKIADGLELTVDYGFLWWIGQPIFALLKILQSFVINWGFAIILVTIAIKMLLYPLARAQYRSFAKMRLLQPKMTAMKERYGDDRQQMSMKMMELYKKEKVNPLGGCFPLLIQMPVFIALYWVLMESVELRHAPFILWIDDLSVKDPTYVLPLLMGASMYLMQKMQPMSPNMDPMQQKMLQMMPVFMTVFFVFFPAGLVLYWLMNNLISIAQQLYITNQFNKEQEAKNKK